MYMKRINLLMSFLVVMVITSCSNYGTKLEFNGGELYYTKNVNKEDAEKLGKYLVKSEFFNGRPKTVQLNILNDTFQFRMVVKEGNEKDQATIDLMKVFAGDISRDVFNGKIVELHMCDKYLKTIKIVQAENRGQKLDFNGGELYYTSNVTEAEAQKLGKFLVDNEFYDGNPKTVQLNKEGDTYQFRMVIKKGLENDPGTLISIKAMLSLISTQVFNNANVVAHLCDEYLTTIKVVNPIPVPTENKE
jgi:hypothetical protein